MDSWYSFFASALSPRGVRQSLLAGFAVTLITAVALPANAQMLYALGITADGDTRTVSKIGSTGVVSNVTLNDGGQGFVVSLAVDPAGNFYVSYDDNTIRKFDSMGNALPFNLTGGSLDGPIAIVLDKSGNLYAANLNNNSISKITPTGAVSTFANTNDLNFPWRLAFDASGNLYTASLDGPAIAAFDSVGNSIPFPALSGGGLTDFNPLSGLAFDADGALYATNSNFGTIVKITNTGSASVVGMLSDSLDGLVIDDTGSFFTIGLNDHLIHKLDHFGNPVAFNLTGDSLNIPQALVFVPAATSASAAPEPATYLLLSIGLVALISSRICRRCKTREEPAG